MRRKPKPLRPGDLVGLVAPSGSVKYAERAAEAAKALEGLGFRVRTYPGCAEIHGYLAGDDGRRAADFNAALADPEVSGIVCLKGGYGTPRILDAIDWSLAARNPKLVVGYSDITGIHLAMAAMTGIPTLHGPMPSSDMLPEFDPFSRASWLGALGASGPLGLLEDPEGSPGRRALSGGRARGPIVGGNLSLVASLMGTPYEIDTRGAILFLEDVDEAPYRIDRMLTQLRLAGKLEGCAGFLLGDWNRCEPPEGKPSLGLEEVFAEILLPLGKPVLSGFRAGHCSPAITFPLGVEALVDADRGTVEILEAATCGTGSP